VGADRRRHALVIDVTVDRGLALYRSRVPLAREIFADTTVPLSYRRVRAQVIRDQLPATRAALEPTGVRSRGRSRWRPPDPDTRAACGGAPAG
jgi:hypothetical protein